MQNTKKPRRKRRVRRILLTLLLLAIAAGALWYAYAALKLEYTVTYDSYTATTGTISNALSFSGNLSLVDSASYTAAASGTVKTVYVSAGDAVQKGDKLVRMTNGDTVTAGFDGRVNTVSVEAGDEVAQGANLVQIADFSRMRVSFRVDEYDISDVSVGQACTVTVTAREKQYPSEVAAIDYISASNGNVAYYTATAYVDDVDSDVLPGMQVSLSIPQEEAVGAVVLKVDAISFDPANQAFVYMMDESGALNAVNITTGVSNGNYIEITDGLKDGDVVYVEAKTDTSSASVFAGLFGSQQFNAPQGGNRQNGQRGNYNGQNGERPDFGGQGGQRPGGGN